MTIGSGLSDAGDAIAGLMDRYHREHQAYDQQLAIAQELSQLAVNDKGNIVRIDPNIKDKTLEPIIAPGALEQFTAGTHVKRSEAIGKLKILNDVGEFLVRHQISSAIQSKMGETGLTGDVKRQQIETSKARKTLTEAQTAKTLGLLPDVPKAPTGGQIIAEQRAQRKMLLGQQAKVADRLINQKVGDQNITDPNLLLDDKNIDFGYQDWRGNFVSKPRGDQNARLARIKGGKDDGTDLVMPWRQFDRLRKSADEWQALGKKANELQTNHGVFNQAWGSISPQQQQVAVQKLNGLTPDSKDLPVEVRKALFDRRFGAGAADTLLSTTGKTAPSATPEPEPDTSGDTDTTDEEDNAGTDLIP